MKEVCSRFPSFSDQKHEYWVNRGESEDAVTFREETAVQLLIKMTCRPPQTLKKTLLWTKRHVKIQEISMKLHYPDHMELG